MRCASGMPDLLRPVRLLDELALHHRRDALHWACTRIRAVDDALWVTLRPARGDAWLERALGGSRELGWGRVVGAAYPASRDEAGVIVPIVGPDGQRAQL